MGNDPAAARVTKTEMQAAGEAGSAEPRPPPKPGAQPVLMVLDATVNGVETSQLLTVQRLPDGAFLGLAEELRKLRIKLAPATRPTDYVPFSELGIAARYDEANRRSR
ncbi:hypothetical protein [Sphingomonas nostoxanthinifaciens]|uniref:hypothetical protein n=1 Tax=Sphingomonas nostoxanthinifaciens TaxID=2872652 RepID=UPI001CC1F133|nr:hypothetical protein [Sphingomonas nostoxanthinifaciens]UAK22992.1 hypothetical protein K8P63_11165 [Sphingomonas nostoxanthinifaciens]